jgi:hypothetical protein
MFLVVKLYFLKAVQIQNRAFKSLKLNSSR